MIKGAFRIWESVLAIAGIAAVVVYALLQGLTDLDPPRIYLSVSLMIAAAALFARPVWLFVNWGHMYGKETEATIIDTYSGGYGKTAWTLTTLAYGKKKKRKTITVSGVMFLFPKIGKTCRLLFSSRRPDEFLILPAAKINAVVYAAVGGVIEIHLIWWVIMQLRHII